MKKPRVHRLVQILTVILSGCILLASCGIGPSESGESKAIMKVVKNLLDDMQSGTFAEDDYESDYAKDSLFAELDLDDDVLEIMNAGLELISFKITDAEGDEKDEEGSCDVTVTAVDLEEILSDIDEDDLDADTLMDAFKDEDAPTKKSKITLDMIFDEDEEEWLVGDTGPLVEVLGEPFSEVTFGFREDDMLDLVDDLLSALPDADMDEIDAICSSNDSSDFFPEDDPYEISVRQAFYGLVSYESGEDAEMDGEQVTLQLSLTMPDIAAIVLFVSEDSEIMGEAFKSIILSQIIETDMSEAEDNAKQIYGDALIEAIQDSSADYITVETEFVFEPGSDADTWVILQVPQELYDFDTSPSQSDEAFQLAMLRGLEMLLEVGSITQETYDLLVVEFGGSTLPAGDTMAGDVDYFYWYDYTTGTEVTSFDSSTATSIEFDIVYKNVWPGTQFRIDWYYMNGTELYFTMEDVMNDIYNSYSTYILPIEGDTMPADTYRVVFSLMDGTIIADESVVCN